MTDNKPTISHLFPFSWVGDRSTGLLRVKSTSSGDSMTELWGNFMNRDKSPSSSRVSSRRASSLYMMGRSTDSAVSDGENGYRNNLLRKSSSKTTVPPQSPLYDELVGLSQEYAKYKRIIDLVKGEYEESKSFEVFRRYNKLKGMIKRTVMYTRLGVVPDVSSAIGLGGLMLVNTSSNRWQGLANMFDLPKSEIPERITSLRRRIHLIKNQIESLSDNYESSKRYIPFQRYRLMKFMIKELLSNCEEY